LNADQVPMLPFSNLPAIMRHEPQLHTYGICLQRSKHFILEEVFVLAKCTKQASCLSPFTL